MKRKNTWADATATQEAELDLGDGLSTRLPLGRPLTFDQTAGRVVKAWDHLNKREQIIYGDTGRRNIAPLAAMTEGSVTVRRYGSVVTVAMDAAKFSNAGTFTLAGVMPYGFRPDASFHGIAINLGATDGNRLSISTAGNVSIYTYAGGWVRFYATYSTLDSWPATLPGNPA